MYVVYLFHILCFSEVFIFYVLRRLFVPWLLMYVRFFLSEAVTFNPTYFIIETLSLKLYH